MFSQACVKNSDHRGQGVGVSASGSGGGTDGPLGRHPLSGQTPPADTPSRHPQADTLPRHCSGRYAPYWNVFVLLHLRVEVQCCFKAADQKSCHGKCYAHLIKHGCEDIIGPVKSSSNKMRS